ncbi:unnamed protein product [Paramecium sonneborni]|uniref:Uncharacterized protein n=1 Tax=Paramecium sonneborni TaxID=65129 RepID=A0A8S1RG66_9CILI|nr:unnamed protein product [Paramecium sonneborni]
MLNQIVNQKSWVGTKFAAYTHRTPPILLVPIFRKELEEFVIAFYSQLKFLKQIVYFKTYRF